MKKINLFIIFIMFLESLILLPHLPSTIISTGESNYYSSKNIVAWFFPASATAVFAIFQILLFLDLKKNKYWPSRKKWKIVQTGIIFYLAYAQLITFYTALNPKISPLPPISFGLVSLFILLGYLLLRNQVDSERNMLGIQMHTNELLEIVKTIKTPINFLIFGLGNDSIFWSNLNKNGRTVFIEDNKDWFDNIKTKFPFLEAYLINYGTVRKEWKSLIGYPKKLDLNLPDDILKTSWNVILVDGPAGYSDQTAGRMKSIYMASKLIKTGGNIFVHDTNREVEREYCDKFLFEKNLISRVNGLSTLSHYKIS